MSAAKESREQKTKSQSVSIQFFGSQAIENLFNNQPNHAVLNSLMGDVPFIKAIQDICMSRDATDLSVASIKAFYDGVSLASMVKTAMDSQSTFSTFCGEFTDGLGITSTNADGVRQLNPTIGLKYHQYERSTIETDEIATRLKVHGTVQIKGDIVTLEGGCQIKAKDIIVLAKRFHLACGAYHYQSQTSSKGFAISAQARDGANIAVTLESQQATTSNTIHHPGLLQAERSIFITAEDSIVINSGQIRALKTYVRARVLQLITIQDTFSNNNSGGGLTVGLNTPKIEVTYNNQRELEAKAAEITTLCGEQQLEIFAEKIFQAGSLIDAPGTLEICHLSGKPLLAVTNDLDDLHVDELEKLNFRSYNFVAAKFPGTPLQTMFQACEQEESMLLPILNSLNFHEIRHVLIASFCQCLPFLASDDSLFKNFTNFSAHKEKLISFNGHGMAIDLANELSPAELEKDLLLFLQMIKNNFELLLISLELLALIISKFNKKTVIWQKQDEADSLIRKYGNDLCDGAIHILLNQDGSCSRLLQTTHKTQLVDWEIDDLKDFHLFKSLAVASGVCGSDYTNMLKVKHDEERTVVRASVYAGENKGQAIPANANQNPVTQRVTTKSTHQGFGFFHDSKRARVLDDLITPKSTSQCAEPGSSEWDDAFEAYFEYVAEKVYELVKQSNLIVEKSVVDGALQSLIATLNPEEVSRDLSELPNKLAAQSKEYRDFSALHSLLTDTTDPTTTALMWMALDQVKDSPLQPKPPAAEKLRQDIAKATTKATSAVSKTVKTSTDTNGVKRTRDNQGRFRRGVFTAPTMKKKSIEHARALGSIQLLEKATETEIGHLESKDGTITAKAVRNRTVVSVAHNNIAGEYSGLKAQTAVGDHLSADVTLVKVKAEAGLSKTGAKLGAEALLTEASGNVKPGAFCLYGSLIEPYFGVQAGIGVGAKAMAGITEFNNGKRTIEFGLKAMFLAGIGGKISTDVTAHSERCDDAKVIGLPQKK